MLNTRSIGLAVLTACLLTLSSLQASFAATPSNVELFIGGKQLDPSGTIRADGTLSGNDVDVDDDLDLETENSFTGGFRYQTRGVQGFRVSYSQFTFSGKNQLNRTITYDDETFLNSTTVESEMKLKFLSADLEYRLTRPGRRDFFNLVFGGRGIEFKGTLRNSSKTKEETASFETGIPVLGVRFRKYLAPRLYLGGRYQGMEATLDDSELQYLDAEVSLGVNLARDVWLVGSYSDLRMEGHNNSDEHFDAKFTGPELSTQFYF